MIILNNQENIDFLDKEFEKDNNYIKKLVVYINKTVKLIDNVDNFI